MKVRRVFRSRDERELQTHALMSPESGGAKSSDDAEYREKERHEQIAAGEARIEQIQGEISKLLHQEEVLKKVIEMVETD